MTLFMPLRDVPVAFFWPDCRCFSSFFRHHASFERRQVVNEQLSLQVIDLVLQADGMHTFQVFFKGLPSRSWAEMRIFSARLTSA